jgi:signal transduction histidine kinase
MAGLPPGTWQGHPRTLEDFDQETIRRATAEVAAAVRGERPGDQVTFETRTLAGEWRWCAARLLRDATGAPSRLAGISLDVTNHHAVQDQLLHAQKMEAVGRLAASVAHDFNNLLTTIGMSVQLLSGFEDPSHLDHAYATEIQKAVESAATLTRQLLSFSRRTSQDPVPLSPAAVVEEMAPLLRRAVGRDTRVDLAVSPANERILADRSGLEQALMNLTVNARDAMPTGGTLSIEVRRAGDGDALGVAQAWRNGALLIRVSDTGTGMDEATAARAFEPFFSTKPEGAGTGLGLATVYRAVSEAGGLVSVESKPGLGTSFAILLPCLPPEPA